MKALKIISYLIIILIASFLVVPIFLPAEMYFEEADVMPVDPVAAYVQVNDLHNWEKWSPWAEMDPKMSVTYMGAETGEGAAYSWEGPVSGSGKLTILEADPYNEIKFKLNFENRGSSMGGFKFEPVVNGTKVIWYMQTDDLNYPVGRWLGIFMPGMLRKDFRKGLENMEDVLTK